MINILGNSYLDTQDVAKLLEVPVRKVYDLYSKGLIANETINGQKYTTTEAIDSYLIAERGIPRIIAFSNLKGGVGKTTIAKNVAVTLSKKHRVLVVDTDTQGNISYGLGVHEHPHTIGRLLLDKSTIEECIVPFGGSEGANLDVIPATFQDYEADIELSASPDATFILRRKLEQVYGDYDVVIIDCSPSLSILSLNALVAAQYIFIPFIPETYAFYGLNQYLGILNNIIISEEGFNPELIVGGIVVSRFDKRRSISVEYVNEVEKKYPSLLLKSMIRENVKITEADEQGVSVLDLAPRSNGANDFRELSSEIMERVREVRNA